ncbi:MAG: ATP synthase F1 subunit delta, partial [Planctomycetota bacterium]
MASEQANSGVAYVYANALYDVAAQRGEVTEVEEELLALQQVLRAEPRFRGFLESPTVRLEAKHRVIRGLLESFHQPLVNFLCLVVHRQRTELLERIVDEYHELANVALGIAEIDLAGARALLEDETAQLTAVLEAKLQRKVKIRQQVRPELLGGF